MAEHDPHENPQDRRDVSRRYRELPREEPPPPLDAAIRAQARRAVDSHPAPLVAPAGRRRWYFPVAAAAVIMLAVAVTSQVEREQGEPALPPQAAAPAPEGQKERKYAEAPPEKPQEQKTQDQKRKTEAFAKRAEEQPAAPAAKPAVPPPASTEEGKNQAPAQSVTGAIGSREDAFGQRDNRASQEMTRQRQERPSSGVAGLPAPQRQLQSDEARAKAAEPQAVAKLAQEPPEKWLERIAQLRKEGSHEEADRQLAEFRKRYPDFSIPRETLEKVERR